jgi:hypothetical protein
VGYDEFLGSFTCIDDDDASEALTHVPLSCFDEDGTPHLGCINPRRVNPYAPREPCAACCLVPLCHACGARFQVAWQQAPDRHKLGVRDYLLCHVDAKTIQRSELPRDAADWLHPGKPFVAYKVAALWACLSTDSQRRSVMLHLCPPFGNS